MEAGSMLGPRLVTMVHGVLGGVRYMDGEAC